MQVMQYVMEDDEITEFTDAQAKLLRDAGLVVPSENIPARLDLTAFVWDDLGLTGEKAILLLRQVAQAAVEPRLTK